MARREIIIDDIDGSEREVEKTAFSLGPDRYEIDLSPENRANLYRALKPFIVRARKTSGRNSRPSRAKTTVPTIADEERNEIRQWAEANGFEVKARGRVPKEVENAYRAAHNGVAADAPH